MAQDSQPQSKPKWGVGSFFQQAVAGVESRLDNILLDEEERQKSAAAKPEGEAKVEAKNTPITRSPAGCMEAHVNRIGTWLTLISSDLTKLIECAEERPASGAPRACYGQIEYGESQFPIFTESFVTSRQPKTQHRLEAEHRYRCCILGRR